MQQTRELSGKRCLVTGGNRGLGVGIVKLLHSFGCDVVVATRTPGSIAISDNISVPAVSLDLASLESVCSASRNFSASFDIVVLNAGVAPYLNQPTKEGLEQALGTNCLGNLAFTLGLLASKRINPGGRIVIVNSETHRAVPPLNVSSLTEHVEYGLSRSMDFYARSKLCLTTVAQSLAERLAAKSISVHTICPGPVATDIARGAPSFVKPLIEGLMAVAFQTADAAARPVVLTAALQVFAGPTGSHHHMYKTRPARADTHDRAVQQQIWKLFADFVAAHPPSCYDSIGPLFA